MKFSILLGSFNSSLKRETLIAGSVVLNLDVLIINLYEIYLYDLVKILSKKKNTKIY